MDFLDKLSEICKPSFGLKVISDALLTDDERLEALRDAIQDLLFSGSMACQNNQTHSQDNLEIARKGFRRLRELTARTETDWSFRLRLVAQDTYRLIQNFSFAGLGEKPKALIEKMSVLLGELQKFQDELWAVKGLVKVDTCRDRPEAKPGEGKALSDQAEPTGEGQRGGNPESEEDRDRAKEKSKKNRLSTRQGDVLKTMLDMGAIGWDNRTTRAIVVKKINRTHKPSSYKRAWEGLSDLQYFEGETGASGGIWLTPEGEKRAHEIKQQNKRPKE